MKLHNKNTGKINAKKLMILGLLCSATTMHVHAEMTADEKAQQDAAYAAMQAKAAADAAAAQKNTDAGSQNDSSASNAAAPSNPPAQSNAVAQSNPPAQSNAAAQSNPPAQSNAAAPSNPPAQSNEAAPSNPPAQSNAAAPSNPPAQSNEAPDNAKALAGELMMQLIKHDFKDIEGMNIPPEMFPSVLRESLNAKGKIDEYVFNAAIKNALEMIHEMNEKSEHNGHIRAIWKALDNPHYARQSILAKAIGLGNERFMNKAATKIINDIAPGDVNKMQIEAVISAAKIAMEYGAKQPNPQNGRSDDQLYSNPSNAAPMDSAENQERSNNNLTEVNKNSCVLAPNFLSKIPANCNVYTINYYGVDGINNFYFMNINGQLQLLMNNFAKVKGPVKWSITYACPVERAPALPIVSPIGNSAPAPLNGAPSPMPSASIPAGAVEMKVMTMPDLDCDGTGFKNKQVPINRFAFMNGALQGAQ